MSLAVAVVIGLAAGILSGMLGIGGGIVLIPGMVLFLGIGQHTAQGVSLGVITVTALAGALTHYHQHNVELRTALWIIPTAILFALLGGWLANMIDARLLSRLFGAFVLIMGGRLLLGK